MAALLAGRGCARRSRAPLRSFRRFSSALKTARERYEASRMNRAPRTPEAVTQATEPKLGWFPAALQDRHGRFHNYLRISLTERCNLRCQYCMPEEGVDLTPSKDLLSADEIYQVAEVFVSAGVDKIRFTGGEPLVRKDAIEVLSKVGRLRSRGLKTIAMTTNGITLSRKLPALLDAGLNAVNISLDTLDPFKFQMITRRNGHDRVLRAIEDAQGSGEVNVKVNCVVMRGTNMDEIVDFVEFTRDRDVEVRFIEYMPFDGNRWNNDKFVSYQEMLELIQHRHPGFRKLATEPNETAKTWHVDGFRGRVGFITSMSENFCSSCNRLRVTADGNLKVCLFGRTEVSLRSVLRSDKQEELLSVISAAVDRKKARHAGMFEIAKSKNRPMITIETGQSWPAPTVNRAHARHFHSSCLPRRFTHLDDANTPTMVDVGSKATSQRQATASCRIELPPAVLAMLNVNGTQAEIQGPKGPVVATAVIAGTLAAKRTPDLIPFCHQLPLDSVKFNVHSKPGHREGWGALEVSCTVKVTHKTGVEMEALTGASIAALTIYDMCKALSQEMVVHDLHLVSKTGGKSDVGRFFE